MADLAGVTSKLPPGGRRALTETERALARSVFRDAIDLDRVEIRRRRWWPFQPRSIVMAPRGHLHFHPASDAYRDDFATASPPLRGLFVHELCHVWQHQRGLMLPLRRHPFCRYDYVLRDGRPLMSYGIEQQAEIVRRAFLHLQADPGSTAPEVALLDAFDAKAAGG